MRNSIVLLMTLKQHTIRAILLFVTSITFSQPVYYKMGDNQILTSDQYKLKIDLLSKNGHVQELFLRTDVKPDSIIKLTKFFVQTKSGKFNPFETLYQQINKKFPIQNFLDSDKKNFSRNQLEGKPTVINFWFTQCPPCIAEIPILNKMREKYGDQVNFIAISFDDKGKIERFLKKQNFNFEQISNAKKQLNDLKISAYPSTLILDRNGLAKFAFPDIILFSPYIEIILEGLL